MRLRVPLWSRLPLAGRLIVALGAFSLLAGLWMLGNQVADDVAQQRQALARQAADEVESLVPAVADQALIGDYTAIDQIARRFAGHANVTMVQWVDERGARVTVTDPPEALEVPELFHQWLGLAPLTETRPVTVGGRRYGTVSLRVSPEAVERHLWRVLMESAVIMAAAWLVGAVVTVAIINRSTAPLSDLDQAVRRLQAGALGGRIEAGGPPEIRRLIATFNAMSEAVAEAQAKMSRSLAETEAARAELARFSEILTHHLQEPVRQIVSFAQILGQGGREGVDSLALIQDGALRLRSLLSDIELYLALSHLPLATEPVSADAALAQARAELAQGISEAGAVIEARPLPAVWLDQRRLSSLFKELIANAIEYCSPDRPPHIKISAEPMGDLVHFAVEDNGIGIKPDYFEKIFGVFNRLHTRQAHPGNGIGLAIVRKIVAGANGHIMVQSQPGQGTTFVFTLPAGQQESTPP
jgi:signal transduction histidine kinase